MTDAELAELDLAVAKVLGLKCRMGYPDDDPDTDGLEPCCRAVLTDDHGGGYWGDYRPTLNWADCGPLIEMFGLEVGPNPDAGYWMCVPWVSVLRQGHGPTPQIAICKAVVAAGGE